MIKAHSLSIYDLGINVKYRMNDFDDMKYHKGLNCHYSGNDGVHFKKVFIDTELSPAFRYEKWIDGKCFIIELPIVSYCSSMSKDRISNFNIECKATILEDDEYREFFIHIGDSKNFQLKKGSWTQIYMLEYGKQVFDFYKDFLTLELHSMKQEKSKISRSYAIDIEIEERRFSSSSLLC